MRIVLDLQACQYESAQRGIGRYSLSLAKALAKNIGEHELILLLNENNDVHQNTKLVDKFDDILDRKNIRFFRGIYPSNFSVAENSWRIKASEVMRQAEIKKLNPDFVHVSSIFDGLADQTLTSIDNNTNYYQSVTFYDLIPYNDIDEHLCDKVSRNFYFKKLSQALRSDILFTISKFTRQSLISSFNLESTNIVNISSDASPEFQKVDLTDKQKERILNKYNISFPFILFAAVVEPRKNVVSLIQAFKKFLHKSKKSYDLVIVGRVLEQYYPQLKAEISSEELKQRVIFCNHVNDQDLVKLYNLCSCFVFPSVEEGFGLPVLEAMRCGAPVICSNASSIPEVIEYDEVLFDPKNSEQICDKLSNVLTNQTFRDQLLKHSFKQAQKFSWDKTAQTVLDSMLDYYNRDKQHVSLTLHPFKNPTKLAFVIIGDNDLKKFANYLLPILSRISRNYEITIFSALDEQLLPTLCEFELKPIKIITNTFFSYDRIVYGLQKWTAINDDFINLLLLAPGIVTIFDFDNQNDKSINFLLSPQHKTNIFYQAFGYQSLMRNFKDLHLKDIKQWLSTINLGYVEYSKLSQEGPKKSDNSLLHEIEVLWEKHKSNFLSSTSRFVPELVNDFTATKDDIKQFSNWASKTVKKFDKKQLLIDITALHRSDSEYFTEYITKNILNSLLKNDSDFRIEPIYRKNNEFYYATHYIFKNYLSDKYGNSVPDSRVSAKKNDVYLGLGFDIESHDNRVQGTWASTGVKICYFVYDLQPYLNYQQFHGDTAYAYLRWIKHIAGLSNKIICTSKKLADEFSSLSKSSIYSPRNDFSIHTVQLGVKKNPKRKVDNAFVNLNKINFAHPSFLVILNGEFPNTFDSLLKAFNSLWAMGKEINLIIVGKNEQFTLAGIDNQDHSNKHLFFYDLALEKVPPVLWHEASALIVPSTTHNFGLPVLEAASNNLPVIAKKDPLLIEIGQTRISYFEKDEGLADYIINWLELHRADSLPDISKLKLISWDESMLQLLEVIQS